jgi:hypothetical protein
MTKLWEPLLKTRQCVCFPISWNLNQFCEEVLNFFKRECAWSFKTRLKIWIDDSHKKWNYPTFMWLTSWAMWCKIPMGHQYNELSTWVYMWMLGIKVTTIPNWIVRGSKHVTRNQKGCWMLNVISQNQTFIFLLPFQTIIIMAS